METLYSEALQSIRRNKTKLEKALKVKISFSKENVNISGPAVNEYIACQAIEAINLGFTIEQVLLLQDETFVLEKINIKDITKRHDLERIRGRIIGTRGTTKKLIQNLSDCFVSVHENTIGIIGQTENIEICMQAIISLIQGKRQGKVYTYLERERAKAKKEQFEDLGLKTKGKEKE